MLVVPDTRLHRTARHEDGRDVQTHGGEQHARSDLVAVADTDERVRLVCVDHVLHAVRDEVPGRQGVEHTVVPHGDSVVDGDRVELSGEAT